MYLPDKQGKPSNITDLSWRYLTIILIYFSQVYYEKLKLVKINFLEIAEFSLLWFDVLK